MDERVKTAEISHLVRRFNEQTVFMDRVARSQACMPVI